MELKGSWISIKFTLPNLIQQLFNLSVSFYCISECFHRIICSRISSPSLDNKLQKMHKQGYTQLLNLFDISGGTLDKLESIPDFNVKLTTAQICHAASEVGCCIASQTREIVPADKKMYAARDVTATVSCIPLIVSSIIAKKAAGRLQKIFQSPSFVCVQSIFIMLVNYKWFFSLFVT